MFLFAAQALFASILAARSASTHQSEYAENCRWETGHGDIIDVEARFIDDPAVLPAPAEREAET